MKKSILFAFMVLAASVCLYGRDLNVASYNVRQMNDRDYRHDDGWDQRKDILCDLIRFNDFDAVGLQEPFKKQLDDILERLPQYDYVGVARDDGKEKGEYSAVLYNKERFKLLKSGTFWLSETPDVPGKGWDAACVRVCSYAKLKDRKCGKVFWFFNTHLDHIGVVARREGCKLILAKIEEIAGPRANIVVTGDFNVDQFSEPYQTILSTGTLKDCLYATDVKFIPGGTFNNFSVERYTISHIDHIFVSATAQVKRFGVLTYHYWENASRGEAKLDDAPLEISAQQRQAHNPSDHYPIMATVRF